jgi:hypothetical protein
MAITAIDERRFNALAGYSRHPRLIQVVQEYDWLASDDGRVLGILTWDRIDYDFGWIVLGRDEQRQFRAIDVDSSLATTELARAALVEAMTRWSAEPDEAYFQGEHPGPPVDFFAPIVPEARRHRNFSLLVEHPRYSPARDLIAAMMPYFEDVDGNFIEQFQTTGFDPRIWELYLFAAFTELGFARDKSLQVPDFVLSGLRGAIAVEATTANPPDGQAMAVPDDVGARRAYIENYIPIKIARALKRKLNRDQAYWAAPALQDMPFILAVQDFHAAGSMMMVVPAATEYVFGVRHSVVEGDRRIEFIDEHRFGGAVEPSGFFRLPQSENISAVLVNPQGTLLKFNRLGHLAGFGDPRLRMVRRAMIRRDGEPDPRPVFQQERVDGATYAESWTEGMVVLHNPHARVPLDPGLLPGATHEFLEPDGRIMSLLPERPVYFSQTMISLEGDTGPPSEEEAIADASAGQI